MADQNGEGAQTTPVAPGADGRSGAASGGDSSQAAATSALLTAATRCAPAGEADGQQRQKAAKVETPKPTKNEDATKAKPRSARITVHDARWRQKLDAKLVEQFDPVLRDLERRTSKRTSSPACWLGSCC